MAEKPGTIVTYPEDLEWEAVGPLDEKRQTQTLILLPPAGTMLRGAPRSAGTRG